MRILKKVPRFNLEGSAGLRRKEEVPSNGLFYPYHEIKTPIFVKKEDVPIIDFYRKHIRIGL